MKKLILACFLCLCMTGCSNKVDATSATIHTNMGDITVELYPEEAPKTVENFVTHAKDGYYDGVIFHRVIQNFMIQGGDPTGTGRGGESIWNKPFEDEFSEKRSNVRGAISMANAGPNTNGSQFFIVQRDSTYLDGMHTVFGKVTEGMDVVDKIASVPTDLMDKPLNDVVIESITVK